MPLILARLASNSPNLWQKRYKGSLVPPLKLGTGFVFGTPEYLEKFRVREFQRGLVLDQPPPSTPPSPPPPPHNPLHMLLFRLLFPSFHRGFILPLHGSSGVWPRPPVDCSIASLTKPPSTPCIWRVTCTRSWCGGGAGAGVR